MKFTFAAIDIGITLEEKRLMLDEVLNLNDDMHHWNKFRGCKMIGIYNGGGRLGGRVKGVDTKLGEFKYTIAGEKCPTIKKVCEEKIFPFMTIPGRVTILRTEPNTGLNVHIDSAKHEIGTLQHKYRLVLNGNIEKLYFLDKNLNKVYVPPHYDSYVMDGSHVHSIDPSTTEKITLCIGAPWQGQDNDYYEDLLKNSLYSMSVSRPLTCDSWIDPALEKK